MYPIGFYDVSYILVIIGVVLCLLAQSKVKTTYARYSRVRTMSGITGQEAAERILRQEGIYDVAVVRVSGTLTDHYDPRNKTLALSDAVFDQTSVAAVSVAAHECGHAVQDSTGYAPLRIRGALVPVANFGAQISWPMIILGIVLGWNRILIEIGIIMFTAVVLFHFITLPVEFNASSRALKILDSSGMLQGEENTFAKKVLSAAAMTYVASAASMALQLLRLLLLSSRRD